MNIPEFHVAPIPSFLTWPGRDRERKMREFLVVMDLIALSGIRLYDPHGDHAAANSSAV